MLKKLIYNIAYFLKGHYYKILSKVLGKDIYDVLPDYMKIQYIVRLATINRECYNSGSCKCGCDIYSMLATNKMCEDICYCPFITREHLISAIYYDKHSNTYKINYSVVVKEFLLDYAIEIHKNFVKILFSKVSDRIECLKEVRLKKGDKLYKEFINTFVKLKNEKYGIL